MRLPELGWSADREAAFGPYREAGFVPGRVAVEHKDAYVLYVDGGELRAGLAGRLRRETAPPDRPAVGDWVAVRPPSGDGSGVIGAVLPRTSAFSRKAPGRATEQQVVAANVDVVLVVTPASEPPNARSLERYVALAWESGAEPVVVLSKCDLAADAPGREDEVRAAAIGVPVLRTSAVTGEGLDRIREYLSGGRTLALLGPSGVGKSRLVNALLGEERLRTGPVRDYDRKGRHTTTRRELVALPEGGLLLDTPGMRGLQLWGADTGLSETFADVIALAPGCRFRDCRHTAEPDCAVRAAVEAGRLDPARLAAYHKLHAELRHLESQVDPELRRERRREARAGDKAFKTRVKRKHE
jgi:ribosome biogenesis GTPase